MLVLAKQENEMTKSSPGIQKKAPPSDIEEKEGKGKERALEQGLDESMDGSDPPSVTQPGKNFVGPND